jgi:hypothetical protein
MSGIEWKAVVRAATCLMWHKTQSICEAERVSFTLLIGAVVGF